MPRKILPRIVAVSVGRKPQTLRIRWNNGEETSVNVSGLIANYLVYAPLRRSAALFSTVRVGELGTDVVWDDDIDMSADSLWHLAQEQSGQTLSAKDFKRWRERKAMTRESAAAALGLSRRMVAYYERGAKPIPRVVALATHALDSLTAL